MVAEDGQAGVELYERESADLVILDLYMPRLDGLATIQAMRTATPRLPIIAMSGGGAFGQAKSFLDVARTLGAVRTFEKPLPLDAFLAMVGEVLHAHGIR